MAEIEGIFQHPALEEVNTLQDAVFLYGLGEALEGGRIGAGAVRGQFIPWEDADQDYPISQLTTLDTVSGTYTTFAFAPPADVQNPMYIREEDTTEPGIINIVPVIARVLLKPNTGVVGMDAQGQRIVSTELMFNFTGDATIMSFDESLDTPPRRGEFDDTSYRSARRVLARLSPLHQMLEFVAAHT